MWIADIKLILGKQQMFDDIRLVLILANVPSAFYWV